MLVRQHYPDRWLYGLHHLELWFPIYRLIQTTIPVSLWKRRNLKVTELVDGRVRSIPGHSVRPLPSACDNLLLDTDVSYLMVIKLEILMYVGYWKPILQVLIVSQLYIRNNSNHQKWCVGEMAQQEHLLWLGLRQTTWIQSLTPKTNSSRHLQLRI